MTRDKVTVDDIIGIVHTDETTNSVEEVRKLRGRENKTEKRCTLHIKWYNIEKTEGEALLKDNGQPLLETERIDDARLLKNILNDLYNENEQLKADKQALIDFIKKEFPKSHKHILEGFE